MSDLDAAWTRLETAAKAAGEKRIVEFFDTEPQRLETLTLDVAGLHLDLSKQAWDEAGLEAALDLAHAAGVEAARARMLGGEAINSSEGRAVLHVALRAKSNADIKAQGVPVMAEVEAVRERMKAFSEAVRSGAIKGATGKPFKAILHIGIGGSDLGPRLLWDALRPAAPAIDLRFVANVDGAEFLLTTADLDPEETLVVVVSKTFTTQETMSNAAAARAWLVAALGEEGANAHLAAVSTALDKTSAFGVADERVFGFWDWVGGRYSLWSAIGLPIAIAIGAERFRELLAGARAMDDHFTTAPLERNLPVIMGLLGVWYADFFRAPTRAVLPYDERLRLLPSYLQQLEMESNGKRVDRSGAPLPFATSPVVWGEPGTNAQHAYFQMLHQGSDVVPVEFILLAKSSAVASGISPEASARQHRMLMANGLAQSQALMQGRASADEPHRDFPGNRPSTTLLLERLTPRSLGALLALYEHRDFTSGAVWGIDPFDQWGDELGKSLGTALLRHFEPGQRGAAGAGLDVSTAGLLQRLLR